MEPLPTYLAARAAAASALTRQAGRGHTAREILQQPWTWRTTADQLSREGPSLANALLAEPPETVVLLGAGTSDYVGRSVRDALHDGLRAHVAACPTTDFILRPRAFLPERGRVLMAHFARSGNSPESAEALRVGLALLPDRARHWVVTCNDRGHLAEMARRHPSACALTLLHPATHDQGLAMTSSYSNMALAGLWLAGPERFFDLAERLAQVAETALSSSADTLAELATRPFERAFYLGTGALEAAAIESALKMQELTRGIVLTKPDTFLAFRHGPISALRRESLLVAFFSSDPHVRRYEEDLAAQLRMGTRVFVCDEAADALRASGGAPIEIPGYGDIPDTYRAPIAVLVGQLLAFFRALALGVDPDDPAGKEGMYSRVVQGVRVHPYRG
jgi:tagatose-6-phosphate ketose/aldose isomerase